MSNGMRPMEPKSDTRPASLESMRFYLWLLADRKLDSELKQKVAPSDVVQQTYLEAHQDRERFRGTTRADFRSWIRTILLNNVRNVRRNYRASKRDAGRETSLELTEAPRDEQRSPSSMVAFDEEFELLETALSRLPDIYRRAIELRSMEQLPFSELGQQIDRTPEAARKVWFRAVQSLQREMATLR